MHNANLCFAEVGSFPQSIKDYYELRYELLDDMLPNTKIIEVSRNNLPRALFCIDSNGTKHRIEF